MLGNDDSQLVKECLRGDRSAFESLVDRYQKVIFNVVLRIVGDTEDAQDIAQSVFLKVYENLRSFNPRYKFFSWIYRIAVNESINNLHAKRLTVDLDENVAADTKPVDESFHDDQMVQRLERALMRVKIEHRAVLVLRHFQDLSYREIADVLKIPEKTVKSRLFSARQDLKEILSPKTAEP